jgi:hypothetical protein
MKKKTPNAQPAKFSLEIADVDLTEAEVEAIQNSLAKALAAQVKGLGPKARNAFGQWGSFNRWGSFGSSI